MLARQHRIGQLALLNMLYWRLTSILSHKLLAGRHASVVADQLGSRGLSVYARCQSRVHLLLLGQQDLLRRLVKHRLPDLVLGLSRLVLVSTRIGLRKQRWVLHYHPAAPIGRVLLVNILALHATIHLVPWLLLLVRDTL